MNDMNIARAFLFLGQASDFVAECSQVLGRYFSQKAVLEAAVGQDDNDNLSEDNI